MVSVVLQLALARVDERSLPLARARLDDAWRPPGRSRARLDSAEVPRLCALVRETRAQWDALEPAARLTLRWPLPAPSARDGGRRAAARRRGAARG
jgi:hypothetical protein